MIEYMRGAPKLSRTVAICHYHRHYGNLSPKLMKQHDCLRKNCPFLERVEVHSFWERRAERRELRKARKAELSSRPEHGIKKEARIGIVRTQEKTVYREKLPINDAFSDLMSLFEESGTCTAYSLICLSHTANEYGEREPYPILETTETYFSLDDALLSTMRRNRNKTEGEPETDYLLVEDTNGNRRGYRIDHENKEYHEIDLHWGRLYPLLERKMGAVG